MSKQSFGFKMRLGIDNIDTLMDLLNVTFHRIRKAMLIRKITPNYKFTGIEIINNQDFSYSIMFNFDNKPSIEDILDKAIIEDNN